MAREGVVTLRAELGFGNGSRAQGFTLEVKLNEAVIHLIILSIGILVTYSCSK